MGKENKRAFPQFIERTRFEHSAHDALFYGFLPMKTPHMIPADTTAAHKISDGEIVVDSDTHESGAWVSLPEKIALLREYTEKNMASLPQPVMVVYKKPLSGDKRKAKPTEFHFGLDIIGTGKSIAEAILIEATLAMLTSAGHKELSIELNSIGDKESTERFSREVSAYYKKNIGELPSTCREKMKKDIFSLLGCEHESCKKLATDCPKSINFLSERSRTHFKEVLEYIETLDIPYSINNTLVANRDYCSEIVFEVRANGNKHPLAIGIRYDTLAKKIGGKRDMPAVGVSIALKKTPTKFMKSSTIEKLLSPRICFMQLGFEAKLKSLLVLNELRRVKIPVLHSLAKDKISGQNITADRGGNMETFIIMGKKEAMENSVIVRDAKTHAQETVLISALANYLKNLKK